MRDDYVEKTHTVTLADVQPYCYYSTVCSSTSNKVIKRLDVHTTITEEGFVVTRFRLTNKGILIMETQDLNLAIAEYNKIGE